MDRLRVHLFGKPVVQRASDGAADLHCGKAQELLCYLLLNRNRAHTRESLAALLWPEIEAGASRKYLRQALWQLHQDLERPCDASRVRILTAEDHGIRLDLGSEFWLDVEIFERAWSEVQGCRGEQLSLQQAAALDEASALYRGDLLEGWYLDWCLCERERLQTIFLMMLDKLMGCSEVSQEYEKGIAYGEQILRYDRARERTYQRMMRLQFLAGDRAGGLRQFQRCSLALDEELGVRPSKLTLEIYEQLKSDRMALPQVATTPAQNQRGGRGEDSSGSIARLKSIRTLLKNLQKSLQDELREIDQVLRGAPSESLGIEIAENPKNHDEV